MGLDSLLGTAPPTTQEALDIRDFYPEGCYFHWNPRTEKIPEGSLILFRQFRAQGLAAVCKDCRVENCSVRCKSK